MDLATGASALQVPDCGTRFHNSFAVTFSSLLPILALPFLLSLTATSMLLTISTVLLTVLRYSLSRYCKSGRPVCALKATQALSALYQISPCDIHLVLVALWCCERRYITLQYKVFTNRSEVSKDFLSNTKSNHFAGSQTEALLRTKYYLIKRT